MVYLGSKCCGLHLSTVESCVPDISLSQYAISIVDHSYYFTTQHIHLILQLIQVPDPRKNNQHVDHTNKLFIHTIPKLPSNKAFIQFQQITCKIIWKI